MRLGCDFMRVFLQALHELFKGLVGGCSASTLFSPEKSEKHTVTLTAHVIA